MYNRWEYQEYITIYEIYQHFILMPWINYAIHYRQGELRVPSRYHSSLSSSGLFFAFTVLQLRGNPTTPGFDSPLLTDPVLVTLFVKHKTPLSV